MAKMSKREKVNLAILFAVLALLVWWLLHRAKTMVYGSDANTPYQTPLPDTTSQAPIPTFEFPSFPPIDLPPGTSLSTGNSGCCCVSNGASSNFLPAGNGYMSVNFYNSGVDPNLLAFIEAQAKLATPTFSPQTDPLYAMFASGQPGGYPYYTQSPVFGGGGYAL